MKRRHFFATACATGLAATSLRISQTAEPSDNDDKIIIPKQGIPYQPVRSDLYSFTELFTGFDASDPGSWRHTLDFSIYRHFVKEGRDAPDNPYMGMLQALHDSTITQSTKRYIAGRKVAAIMGGHKMERDAPAYRNVALLTRKLARNGILVCTGGGPGAMEASHLGGLLATEPESSLDDALDMLKTQSKLPDLTKIVAPDGSVDESLLRQAHAWFKPAYEIAKSSKSPGESLAIPTWHYGHEPSSPFATHIAKYFQNSIREEGLLAVAKQGIVYAEGKAGTIQEIFQDAAQNYYKTYEYFSPMVFLGKQYWTEEYPVVAVLKKLFGKDDFEKYVLVTDDIAEAADFITRFVP